jgi:hypothetical protein
MSLIRMFMDGPVVSLNGSPTVSPTTAARCVSDPLPPRLSASISTPIQKGPSRVFRARLGPYDKTPSRGATLDQGLSTVGPTVVKANPIAFPSVSLYYKESFATLAMSSLG